MLSKAVYVKEFPLIIIFVILFNVWEMATTIDICKICAKFIIIVIEVLMVVYKNIL